MTTTAAAHDAPATAPISRAAALPAQERLRPLPDTMSTRDALAHYLAENGFDTKGYTAPTYEIEAFGRRYVFKNTPNRKWAIPLHDLHHVATGYGTDLVGEAEIGVWELMGGCRTPIVYALNIVAVLFGALLAPLRVLRAVRDSRRARALYRLGYVYEELLALPLGELRRRLGIPSGGVAWAPRRLHDNGERTRADALPGAPPVPGWAAVFAMIYGLATLGTVAFEFARGRTLEGVALEAGAVRGSGMVCAVLAALLAASTPAARRGSLGGRALFGMAALGLLSANIMAAASLGAAAGVSVMGIVPAAVLLVVLARGK